MDNSLITDVLHLPVADRIRLAQAIWDSVAEAPESVRLSETQRLELDRCYEEYLSDPDQGSPWPEVKKRLLSTE